MTGLPAAMGALGSFQLVKLGVDVRIERELALLDEAQSGHGGERFADGAGLEHGVFVDRRAAHAGNAKASRPLDDAMMKDGNAHAGNLEFFHALGEVVRRGGATFKNDGADQAVFDMLNALGDIRRDGRHVLGDGQPRHAGGDGQPRKFVGCEHGRKPSAHSL